MHSPASFPPVIFAAAASPALTVYDLIVIGAFLLSLASMGWIFRRFTHGSTDYFAGGFRMTWWLLGATSFVSNFSSWVFTGGAGMAYTYGMVIFGFFAIDVAGFLLNYLWFAPRFRQLRLITAMDGIRLRFGRINEQFFTWLSFFSTLAVAAVWMVSLSIILSTAFAFPPVPVILVTGTIVVLIALLGGNWAVSASDFVQLVLLIGVSVIVAVLTVGKIGGVGALIAQIPEGHWQVFHPAGTIPYDWVYLATGILSAIYMRNNVTAAAKYIAAKDSKHARRSALVPLIGYIVMPVFWFIPAFAAFTLVPDLADRALSRVPAESAYIAVCMEVLPQGMLGLMIAAMFAATISSMDVALNKNAGVFAKNFYQPLLRPKCSDRELLVVGELSTVFFGALIIGCALFVATGANVTLFDAYLYVNSYLGVPLAVPMFLGMIVRRVPAWAGWSTTLFGVACAVFLMEVVPTAWARGWLEPILGEWIYGYCLSNRFVVTNLVGVPLTMAFFLTTRWFYRAGADPKNDTRVAAFFQNMNTPVDFAREVGHDNTAAQASMIGRVSVAYGAAILLLVLIPNPWSGRFAILSCALLMLGMGQGLLVYARRVRRREAAGHAPE